MILSSGFFRMPVAVCERVWTRWKPSPWWFNVLFVLGWILSPKHNRYVMFWLLLPFIIPFHLWTDRLTYQKYSNVLCCRQGVLLLLVLVVPKDYSTEVGVGWLCRCPGIVWEPIRKRAHTQLVREHLVTVVSVRWATVDWFCLKERN